MPRSFLALCLAVSVLMSGCAHRYSADYFAVAPDAPYTVASGDRLRIIVFGQDALSNSYAVDGSGHISLPLVGLVPVNGMTTADIQHAIENRLRNGFVRDPKVSAEIEAYRPFFILGEVTTAGQYPYVNGMTVQMAVAIAGGFTPRAAQSGATLTRTVQGQPVAGEVPMIQPVRPGDTIVIRERFF